MSCYVDGFLCSPGRGFRAIDEALHNCDVHECQPDGSLRHPRVWTRLTACRRLAVASYLETDTDIEAVEVYLIVYAGADPVVASVIDDEGGCGDAPRITASLISQAITRVLRKRGLLDANGYSGSERINTAKGYIEQTIFALAVYLSTSRWWTPLPAFFANEDCWSIFGEDSAGYDDRERGYETYPSAVFADMIARAGRLHYIGGRFIDAVPAAMVPYSPSKDVARDFRQLASQWNSAGPKHTREKSVRKMLWNSYPHICGICGKQIDSFDEMHVDHIIPLSRGGKDIIANLQLTHAKCNLKKGSDTPEGDDGLEDDDDDARC